MIEPWSEGSLFLWPIYQNIEIVRHYPKIGSKRVRICISYTNGDRKMKVIVKGNLRWTNTFWSHHLKILTFLAFLKVLTSSTQKWLKKVQTGISCTNVNRKMRIKSKRYFQDNYSFMKPFSQNFEVFTQCCDIIYPKLPRKRIQTGISCTNGDRKIKIKSKKNFEVRYSFMKLFSGNLKILAPCCDAIIPKLGQKDSRLYIR